MFLLIMIPIVNIVLLLIWAFGDVNRNRKSFARATLLLMLISFLLTILLAVIGGGLAHFTRGGFSL